MVCVFVCACVCRSVCLRLAIFLKRPKLAVSLTSPTHQLACVFMHFRCCACIREMRHKTRAIATSSLPVQRIVEDCSRRTNSGGSAFPQTKHIPMQLARIAAKTDLGVQLHREVWPIIYWLHTRYALKVLHFSHVATILYDKRNRD